MFTYDLDKMKQAVESERVTIPKEALDSFESFDKWISEEDTSVKKDPNNYCVNYRQNLKWALIRDIIAHPLMAITLYKCELFIKFHDYTSSKAWERDL